MTSIDLDQNATTPLDPEVLEAMSPLWLAGGNAESRHAAGRSARRALERARESVAVILGAGPGEVVFTSGGTEANNLAIFGLAGREGLRTEDSGLGAAPRSPARSSIPAVAEAVATLEAAGATRSTAPGSMLRRAGRRRRDGSRDPPRDPVGDPDARQQRDRRDPAGRAPWRDRLPAEGSRSTPTPSRRWGGSRSTSGPWAWPPWPPAPTSSTGRGAWGLLLVREGVKLAPRLFGGGQQGGRRPGTPAVALAVGLARALERWRDEAEDRARRWARLPRPPRGGDREPRSARARSSATGRSPRPTACPQTLNLGFPGVDGDALLMQLDLAGVSASLGSACASGATEPSPTLLAMGVPADRLRSSVRFSFGAGTTEAEVDEAVRRVVAVVGRIARAGDRTAWA